MLREAGTAATPTLVGALKEDNPDVRGTAARLLGRLGPEAKAAAPALTPLLEDTALSVRVEAAAALWRVARWPRALVTLGQLLQRRGGAFGGRWWAQRDVVRQAKAALADFGAEGMAGLTRLLDDDDADTRDAAVEALASHGPTAVPELANTLWTGARPVARCAAARCLGRVAGASLGEKAKAAYQALHAALRDPAPEVGRLRPRPLPA